VISRAKFSIFFCVIFPPSKDKVVASQLTHQLISDWYSLLVEIIYEALCYLVGSIEGTDLLGADEPVLNKNSSFGKWL
jgi:hypothetical protein